MILVVPKEKVSHYQIFFQNIFPTAVYSYMIHKNIYLFYYDFGAYGATYAKGEGTTSKEGLKDAFENYACGIGGEEPSSSERKNFIKEAILIATFTSEGEVIENDSSIGLLVKAFS